MQEILQLKMLVRDLQDKREAKMRTSIIKFMGQFQKVRTLFFLKFTYTLKISKNNILGKRRYIFWQSCHSCECAVEQPLQARDMLFSRCVDWTKQMAGSYIRNNAWRNKTTAITNYSLYIFNICPVLVSIAYLDCHKFILMSIDLESDFNFKFAAFYCWAFLAFITLS